MKMNNFNKGFIICILAKYCLEDKVKEDKMSCACGTQEREGKGMQDFGGEN
jgi:hypothetical protein